MKKIAYIILVSLLISGCIGSKKQIMCIVIIKGERDNCDVWIIVGTLIKNKIRMN